MTAATRADVAEWHIASLVVYAARKRTEGIAEQIARMPNAEVHGLAADTGRIVVTLEGPGANDVLAQIQQIQHIDGVLSAALVYQCADTEDAMNEEVSDAHRPT